MPSKIAGIDFKRSMLRVSYDYSNNEKHWAIDDKT